MISADEHKGAVSVAKGEEGQGGYSTVYKHRGTHMLLCASNLRAARVVLTGRGRYEMFVQKGLT